MQQGTILKPKGRKVTLTICLVIRPVQKEQTEDLSVRKLWVRKAGYIILIYEVKNLSPPRLSVTERFKMKYYSGFKYTWTRARAPARDSNDNYNHKLVYTKTGKKPGQSNKLD